MASLLPSSQNSSVSKSNDITSLKQYIDLQWNQLRQCIGGIEEKLKKFTQTIENLLFLVSHHMKS
jgi:prefoldin subunit 5